MPEDLPRHRLRQYGLKVGTLPTGPLNAITDVADVRVGHVTLREGAGIRTGVTAILPHGENLYQQRVPAGIAVGNGFGKLTGFTQVQELGELETPIVLTNTLSVAAGLEGVIEWTLRQAGNQAVCSVNAVVGETNDGVLNDIRRRVVKAEHVLQAIEDAQSGPVPEGAVGAGTGTVAFGFKGGIGSSSRAVDGFTVGVLVQSNFGGDLTICGVPVASRLQHTPDGSIMIVVATDAPLSERNLTRLARRAFIGLGRTGSSLANGSGDYALAFSTAPEVRRTVGADRHHLTELPNERCTPLFQAAAEATEEAILNSLFMSQTVTGFQGQTIQALPLRETLAVLRAAGWPVRHPA